MIAGRGKKHQRIRIFRRHKPWPSRWGWRTLDQYRTRGHGIRVGRRPTCWLPSPATASAATYEYQPLCTTRARADRMAPATIPPYSASGVRQRLAPTCWLFSESPVHLPLSGFRSISHYAPRHHSQIDFRHSVSFVVTRCLLRHPCRITHSNHFSVRFQ